MVGEHRLTSYHNAATILSPNHSHTDLLQVLSILTMERPVSFSSEDIRDEKVS